MKKLKLLGLFLSGLIVGVVATGWYSQRVLFAQIASKEVDLAFNAAEQAEWLAELRLNEPHTAIEELERTMDIAVCTLAQWEGVNPLDEKTRLRRDRFLVPVKVYHESYPVVGEDKEEASLVNSLLAKVPERNPRKVCKSSVCRLDDLRRGMVSANTNSPFK